jgi:tetratricopeptide (TPR) repeat protein
VEEQDGEARVQVTLATPFGEQMDTKRFDFPLDSAGGSVDVAAHLGEIEAFLRRRIGQQVNLTSQRAAARDQVAWTLLQRAEYERKRAETLWKQGDTTRAGRAFAAADSLAGLAAGQAPRWAGPPTLRGQLAFQRSQLTQRPEVAAPLLELAAVFGAKAVELDPRDADALELRGTDAVAKVVSGVVRDSAEVRAQVGQARQDLEAAVAANPKQASAWVRLSQVAYQQFDRTLARDAARSAYQADAYLENAPNIIWRLFATAYDVAEPVEAQKWCAVGQERFPDEAFFLRCELLIMTMRGETPNVARGWEIVEELRGRWPRPELPFEGRWDRMLMAAALGRAGLADSARAVMLSARASREVDPRGELQGLEAFARTVVGDKAEALDLLEGYLREFPQHREGFRRLNTWWWQDIQNEPRYVTLTRGG